MDSINELKVRMYLEMHCDALLSFISANHIELINGRLPNNKSLKKLNPNIEKEYITVNFRELISESAREAVTELLHFNGLRTSSHFWETADPLPLKYGKLNDLFPKGKDAVM